MKMNLKDLDLLKLRVQVLVYTGSLKKFSMKILDKYYSKILEVNTLNEVDKPLLKNRLKKLMTEEVFDYQCISL